MAHYVAHDGRHILASGVNPAAVLHAARMNGTKRALTVHPATSALAAVVADKGGETAYRMLPSGIMGLPEIPSRGGA